VEINLNALLNPKKKHREIFQATERELVVYGGANAGKTFSVADKILLQPAFQGVDLKVLCVRRTLASAKKTTMELFENEAEKLGVPFELKRQDSIAEYSFGSRLYFVGMNNKEDIMRIKGMTDIDIIWANELAELREEDYKQLLLKLRGGKGKYHQMISDFNPIGTSSWIFKRMFKTDDYAGIRKIRLTVEDNPWVEREYVEYLDKLKEQDPNYYKIYRLGEWGDIEGAIYTNWDIVQNLPTKIDEIIYGLDFGFNNPTALLRIYLAEQEFWIEELLYKTHLTNARLIEEMGTLGINATDPIYCDSAEPARIEEIRRAGFNSHPSDKDVKAGIDFLKSKKLHILEGSANAIGEFTSAAWAKDKDGAWMEMPVKFKDHCPDAARYAIYTHCVHRAEPRVWRA